MLDSYNRNHKHTQVASYDQMPGKKEQILNMPAVTSSDILVDR
jgi:hypothetical protein